MSILVTGSVAIDHIMVFRGRFKDVILPDRLHVLNVAFHVPELRKTFGGCAANVAFNLRLLGEAPILLGSVGRIAEAPHVFPQDVGALDEEQIRHVELARRVVGQVGKQRVGPVRQWLDEEQLDPHAGIDDAAKV